MRLHTILCAVDLSEYSLAVLHYAAGLAQRYQSRLIVFHAVYSARDPIYGSALFERGGEQNERIAQAHDRITSWMAQYPLLWEAVVQAGEPVETAAGLAEELSADLVVAASHGLTGIRRILLGKVVERMARTMSQALLIVRRPQGIPAGDSQYPPLALNRILVGCNLRQDCLPALRYAANLARDWDAELDVLHAMESPVDESVVDPTLAPYSDVQRELETRLRERLAGFLPAGVPDSTRLNTWVVPGPGSDALLAWCRQEPPDLMVVGVRHHPKIKKVILGSTTEAMLRDAPCPVLVVPAHL